MNQKITINANANNTPIWIQPGGVGSTFQRCSYSVKWDGISGTENGTVKVYVSNDPDSSNTSKALLETIAVDSASNLTDIHFVEMDMTFAYIRFEYTKNDIAAGTITIDIMGV